MHRLDLWAAPSRLLGIGLFCLLFLAGCSRHESSGTHKLGGDGGRALRAMADAPVALPMGPAVLQPVTPLQQNENGYWVIQDASALPPLLPPAAHALVPHADDFPRAQTYRQTRDPNLLKRSVPFFDEAALAASRSAIAKSATGLESGAALGWSLGNELALTPNALPLDDDRSPLMLEVFRAWLETQYESIDALNKQWGTRFVRWHEIVPPSTEDVKRAHNPAYAGLIAKLLAPPPPPKPETPPAPVLPKDARIDDPPKPPEPAWETRGEDKGFVLAAAQWRVPGKENYSGWSDWRTFNDFVFNRLLREYAAAARANGIQTPLGLSKALPPLPFNYTDLTQLGRSIQWMEPGDSLITRELLRGLSPNVKTLTHVELPGADGISRLWKNWLRGDSGVLVKRETLAAGADLLQEINFIARTLEPVRHRTVRAVDPVALYYSPRSMQLHWMHDSEGDGSWWPHRSRFDEIAHNGGLLQLEAWSALLTDLGYEPGYIQPEYVTSGQLRTSKLKVLILPKVLSLSDHEAAELREWVKRGGVVIADGACGLYDEHGKRRIAPNKSEWPTGILDADFGLQRNGGTVLERNGVYLGTEKERVWLKDRVTGYAFGPATSELRALEPEIREAGAYCHAVTTAGAAAMLSKAGGLGRMIYLNLALQEYPRLRRLAVCDDFGFEGISLNDYIRKFGPPPGGEAHRLILGDMLSEVIAGNPVQVCNAEGHALRTVHRAHFDAGGGSKVIVLFYDGMLPDPNAWVTLPGNYHWYDVRTGQELGHGDTAKIALLTHRATVLAALPYDAGRVRVSTRRTAPDGVYRIQANVVSGGVPDAAHVFRTELQSPDGELELPATLTAAENGAASWVIQIPPDAPAGTHRLLVHDLLTGKRAEAHLLKE